MFNEQVAPDSMLRLPHERESLPLAGTDRVQARPVEPARTELEGMRRIECECGTMLRAYSLPFGDSRGTFRARCRTCSTIWSVPLAAILDGTDEHTTTTLRLSHDWVRTLSTT